MVKKRLKRFLKDVTVIILLVFSLVGYNYYHNQSFLPEQNQTTQLKVATGVTINEVRVGGSSYKQITKLLAKLARQKRRQPQNAFEFNDKVFYSKQGKRLNITATIQQLLTAEAKEKVEPVYKFIKPTITKDVLKKGKSFNFSLKKRLQQTRAKVIGHYTTYLPNNKQARKNNIRLALKKMNYYYLKPEEEFSFNDLIGQPTMAKGYKKAPIISGDRYILKPGGGICQVSSTLYNAVKEAKLKIIERHHHSKKVAYVPEGRDATIYPGQKDFSFINNSQQPVIILTDLVDRYVIVYLIQIN
ncbi:hypothetical protein JCM16358_07880 [Halanaerocella petrolearia]